MNKQLSEILRQTDRWPQQAQNELAEVVREIEAELKAGAYMASPEELAGIDHGLSDAAQGKFATNEDVEKAFAKFRR